jgi:hypothetical protein
MRVYRISNICQVLMRNIDWLSLTAPLVAFSGSS